MPKLLFPILIAAPLLSLAQNEGAISGPVSGFLYDQATRAIRPVLGVPGSAHLGPALFSGADAGSVAPDGFAAAAFREGRLFVTTGIKTLAPEWSAVEGEIPGVDLFAWAPSALAVYSSRTREARIVRDLSNTRAASAPIDLAALPGRVSAMALAGEALVVGVEDPEAGGVYVVLGPSEAPRLLARASKPVGLAIAGAGVYYADRQSGEIWHAPNVAGGATPLLFAGGIDTPAGLHVDAGRLFAAIAGGKQLRVYDLGSRAELARIDLEFTPASLDSMGSRSQLLMARGAPGEQPYYVLDASRDPAVYFVPAGRAEE